MAANEFGDDQTRSFTALTAGTIVSHYKIISKIGAGGMGEVYLAEDTQLDRKVALKFLPPHLSQDEAARARFTREAKAAAKLDHPNIVQVFEVGEFQGRPFFAMANIEGKPLRKIIKEGKLSINETIELTKQICEGLCEAHNAGVIHRDIKPSNIVIDNKGNARILDFGLATVLSEEKLTKTGSTLGTVGYMSPEQVEGKQTDHRSDLFSVGVLLYEMLTCRRPFQGDNDAAIARSIADHTPEPIARFKSGTTGELQRIIDKALSKNPAHRYQRADDMLTDLRRLQFAQAPIGRRKLGLWLAAAVLLVAGAFLTYQRFFLPGPADEAGKRIMLAVLPFENLGSSEDEYFADGITDEITSRLASVSGLGVISRTSTIQYKKSDKSLPQIAAELGVDYILEGTIRWDKSRDTSRVRITPQLINVSDDTHLWAGNYERALTQIFDVQSDIATEVVSAIGVKIGSSARRLVHGKPTESLEAYDLYLRGIARASRSYEEADFRAAITLLDQALEYDPDFVAALASLAFAHIEMYFFQYDHKSERLRLAEQLLDRAARLEPAHPHVIQVQAMYYYHGFFDYEKALEKFEELVRLSPNESRVYNGIAAIKRRQGKWDEAIRYYETADSLNPRDALMVLEKGGTYEFIRDYETAELLFKRAISLAPDVSTFYEALAQLYLMKEGKVEKCRQFVEQSRDHIDARAVRGLLAKCDIFSRDYTNALGNLKDMAYSSEFGDSSDYFRLKGRIYSLLGDSSTSKLYYDSSLVILTGRPKEAREAFTGRISMAFSLAGLGRKQEALKLAQEAVDLKPIAGDAVFGPGVLWGQALVFIDVGEYEKAIDHLDYLLSIPGWISVNTLKVDPWYDPLRKYPRFKALIEKYSKDAET